MSELLAESEYTSSIDAPIEAIDLTTWVFTLADDEYQRCSQAHVAAGASTDPAGKRISINVEKVGNLIISHYNEDVSKKDHCRRPSQQAMSSLRKAAPSCTSPGS